MDEEAPFSAVAIFAEEVREQQGGRLSILNIFPDTIAVETVPALLATIHAYIRISYDPAHPPHAVAAGLRVGDAAPIMTQHFDPARLQKAVAETRMTGAKIGTIVARFGATNFQVHDTCLLNATVTWNDEEFIVGSLSIRRM
jgi:hypothetical protein